MILVSDFDKTLYPHGDDAAFQENLRAVKEFRNHSGNKFILATGRSLASLSRVLPNFSEYIDFLILDNGSICYNVEHHKIFFEYKIPKQLATEIVARLTSSTSPMGDVRIVYYYDSIEHAELEKSPTKIRCWTENEPASERLVAIMDRELGEQVKSYITSGKVVSTVPWIETEKFQSFFDIVPVEAGKESMIRRLQCEYYPGDDVVTIGDDYNDIGMLQEFDGYAVANARLEVLEVVESDHVVPQVYDLISRLLSYKAG